MQFKKKKRLRNFGYNSCFFGGIIVYYKGGFYQF